MCRRITCNVCAKPSFEGCGLHVESVLGDVPRAERCHCRESAEMPGAQSGAVTDLLTGALRRLLGLVRPDRRRRP